MNEIVLEIFLVAVMAFFMVFGVVGCRKEKEKAKTAESQKNG